MCSKMFTHGNIGIASLVLWVWNAQICNAEWKSGQKPGLTHKNVSSEWYLASIAPAKSYFTCQSAGVLNSDVHRIKRPLFSALTLPFRRKKRLLLECKRPVTRTPGDSFLEQMEEEHQKWSWWWSWWQKASFSFALRMMTFSRCIYIMIVQMWMLLDCLGVLMLYVPPSLK